MALVKGTITVNPDGTHTSSGLAGRIFEAMLASAEAGWLTLFAGHPMEVQVRKTAKESLKEQAEPIAFGIVDEFTLNAEVTVTVSSSDAGLQRLPANLSEDEPTKGPSGNKVLATKGTIA